MQRLDEINSEGIEVLMNKERRQSLENTSRFFSMYVCVQKGVKYVHVCFSLVKVNCDL